MSPDQPNPGGQLCSNELFSYAMKGWILSESLITGYHALLCSCVNPHALLRQSSAFFVAQKHLFSTCKNNCNHEINVYKLCELW